MPLSAESLYKFQHCARITAIERDWKYDRMRPKALFEMLLRKAVFVLSSGGDVKAITDEAVTSFLEYAASPGLDMVTDPFCIARDFCSILQTSLEAISRTVLLTLKPGPLVRDWQVSAFQDESGILHRWTSVDNWTPDDQYRELHSWAVFGDCAATQQGMWLHVIEIGRQRGGHQHTAWARAFKHPAIMGKYRFRKVDGSSLTGDWRPIWYQDSDKNDPKVWVDLMNQDGLLDGPHQLIHHLSIKEPLPEHVEEFWNEVAIEKARMDALGDWQKVPRERGSCDIPYSCVWQPACYAPPGPVNIEGLGGFSRREK